MEQFCGVMLVTQKPHQALPPPVSGPAHTPTERPLLFQKAPAGGANLAAEMGNGGTGFPPAQELQPDLPHLTSVSLSDH